MILDISPEGSGKTTNLVKWANEDPNRYIVTPNVSQAEVVLKIWEEVQEADKTSNLGYRDRVIPRAEWKARMKGLGPRYEVGIDNVEYILSEDLETPPDYLTMRGGYRAETYAKELSDLAYAIGNNVEIRKDDVVAALHKAADLLSDGRLPAPIVIPNTEEFSSGFEI